MVTIWDVATKLNRLLSLTHLLIKFVKPMSYKRAYRLAYSLLDLVNYLVFFIIRKKLPPYH